MNAKLKKQINFDISYQNKSRKIISILVVLFLITTTISSVVSSRGFLSDYIKTDIEDESESQLKRILNDSPLKERLSKIKNKINSLFEKISQIKDRISITNNDGKETNKEAPNKNPITFRKYTFFDAIQRYIKFRSVAQNSLFVFYTNYSGKEFRHNLKLFRFVNIDVNGDGKNDISVKIRFYPSFRKDLRFSINFQYLIKRLDNFPDIYSSFQAYAELYFPGILFKNQKGDRIRFGYESPEGEEVPSRCDITYKYLPQLIYIRKRPEHRFVLNPGSSIGKADLTLLLSYTNFRGDNVLSEIRSRVSYSPAVRSQLTIGGDGLLGGLTFEFVRKLSQKSKINMTCAFEKNNSVIFGYVKDLPEKVSFIIDPGKEGFAEFDTHGQPPSEIGLCNDFVNPVNYIYFKDMPSKAGLEWKRNFLKQRKVSIRFYTIGSGISLLGHLDFKNNGTFDFNVSSNENLDCSLSLDGSEGYLVFERSAVNISFSLTLKIANNSFNLSFNMTRFFDKPFEIFFDKLINEEIQFSLASKSFTLEDFNMRISLQMGEIGIRASKIHKEQNGSIKVNISHQKNEGNLSFKCNVSVINGINLYNFSLGFNGFWGLTQDIILIGNSSRTMEFICEVGGFEYYVADNSSWGYFFFTGNISYASYRDFIINNITGGFKGKILAKTDNDGLNISWYTENKSGYNVTKINVSGVFVGIDNFHLFYGETIDFYIPHFYGNILLKEVCKDSGNLSIELQGGQSNIDLNFSFNFSKGTNSNITEVIVKIQDFHLNQDRSVNLEALWGNKNNSYFVFHTENNINLSIENMYVLIGNPESPTIGIENLTGYLKGYSGFDVNITLPFNSYFTNETKYSNFSNSLLAFELTDVELDLEIRNLTALIPKGRIAIAANVTGTVKFALYNVSITKSLILIPTEVNITWINFTIGFDGRNGEFNLNYLEINNIGAILELINVTLPNVRFELENISLKGYSNLLTSIGFVSLNNKSRPIVIFKFENDLNTQIKFDKIYLYLPENLILNEYLYFFIGNIELGEGTFTLIFDLFRPSIEIFVDRLLHSIELDFGLSNLARFNLNLGKPIEYLKIGYNPGLNEEKEQFLFIDTHNSTVVLNMEAMVTSEFLNNTIDIINNMTNLTFPYIKNDKGFRINNATLKADFFRVYLNFSNRPLYKGYLQIYGDGSIYHLINNSWQPLLPGGEGFSFIIEENHLQLKFDMAAENLPIDFEVIFDNTGNKLILTGLFSVYSDDLVFDIWWDLEEGYIKIISSNNRSLDIENFIFQFINNSIKKIDIQIDLISFQNGIYSLLFDSNAKIFELNFGGSILSIEGFDLEFYQIPLKNIGNSTITLNFESFNLLEGFAIFQTFLESEEYNWSIGSKRGIDWFELTGLKGSIQGVNNSLVHFDAGIGLLKWNRSSNNFLRMKISRNASKGSIRFNRYSDLDGAITIQDVYIRYITPNLQIPIGTRLRSLTAEYQRNDHEYFYLEWKKEEYIDLTADIDAKWKITFERFFDLFNFISKIDIISNSIDVNFSLHYEPSPDNDTANHLELYLLEESSIELLEIVNHYNLRFDKILKIGSMQLKPGKISFDWLINDDKDSGSILINNNRVTGEFTGLTLRKGLKEIKLLDFSIIDPGYTNIYFELNNNSGSLYASNSAELEFTALEFSRGLDAFRIERDLQFGTISMLPGEFRANWINLTDEDYDVEFTINNGVFELTFIRLTLQLRYLKISLSLFNTDRLYENDIIVKLRQRGKGDRGFCITTDDPLQFDLFSFKISRINWELIIDLIELKANFSEWYLGTWNGNFTIGGGGTVKIVGLSRFINITFRWKGEDEKEQELFAQYSTHWENHPQTHALVFDTTNTTEQLDIGFYTDINGLNIDSQLTINPQKHFILHFDMNPKPIDGIIDGHIWIDTDDKEVGNLDIEFSKYVDCLDVDVGLYAEIELLQADEFYIWGEFIEIEILGVKIWVPSNWGKNGSIDFVNIGIIKLIFGTQETEIWPCTPKAILDKKQYGVTPANPIVTFDTSASEGYIFNLQRMRWDLDGDGEWDTGSGPDHWINYEDTFEHDFSDMFDKGEESIKIFFQVKTVAAKSNIAEVTVIKGYALDVDIKFNGDKLYEFKEFIVVVTNVTSNTPVNNAFVTYYQLNNDGSENVTNNYTNSNGEAGFIASEVPYDYYVHYSNAQVYVEADGFFDGESELFKVYDTDAELNGYVRDNITHQGVSNALILADPGGYYTYSEEYSGGMQNGKFMLMVPPGIYDITASKSGYDFVTVEDVNATQGGYQYLGDLYLPPHAYGGLRGIVYDSINSNNELIGVKVTVEIPDKDDIMTTTNNFGIFPHNYPSSINKYYSIDLEPGTYIVKFEMDNYYTSTEQITIVAGEVTEIEVYLCQEWINPFEHNNPSEWHDEDDAHDDKLNTAANTDIYWGSTWHWTEYLELKLSSPVDCDKVRVYAKYIKNRCNRIKIDIYYNNNWYEVYVGSFEDKNWDIIEFDNQHSISKARVSFRLRRYLGVPSFAELYEFDFGLVQP